MPASRVPAATFVGLGVALLLPLLTNLVITYGLGVTPSRVLISVGLASHWAMTLALFALVHVSAVGAAQLRPIVLISGLITLLYLWRRDLLLNMVAHATIDAIGLLVVPAFA